LHFSTNDYLEANADVRKAGVCPLYHYAIVGRLERRQPRKSTGVQQQVDTRALVATEFDAEFYISEYPRTAKSNLSALDHFLQIGWRRGLNPNAQFSTVDYLRNNRDVHAAGINPYIHYLLAGRREGRVPRNEQYHNTEHLAQRSVIAGAFDVAFYLSNNPEVKATGVDPIAHYMLEGWREQRDPAPDFSTNYYLATHGDVREANINPFYHFLVAGRDEGRAARPTDEDKKRQEVRDAISRSFDADFYLSSYSDVALAGRDPLDHYVDAGWRERRDPSASFSTGFYLDANSDVAAAGVNPFYHYIVAGMREGRPARHPGGWRALALTRLKPVNLQIEDALRSSEQMPPLLEAPDLLQKLLDFAGDSQRLVVSVSHDDYTTSVGGVQLCLKLEEQIASERGTIYLNLHPARPLPFLSPERQSALTLVVIVNGERLGVATAAAVLSVLGEVRSRVEQRNLVVHSLLGHSPEVLIDLHRAVAPSQSLFWVHDFFSVCPSYTLLRNGINFCGAPNQNSGACAVCAFGEERTSHLRRMRNLFSAVPFEIVAPSSFAAEFWRSHASLSYRSLVVRPHCQLDLAPEALPKLATKGGPARIAFLGHPSPHKGWEAFVNIAEAVESDDRYRLFHFGTGRKRLRATEFVPVSVLEDGATAMTDALLAHDIDAVVLWSIWPETFSFVTHEALAAGSLILTSEVSGNIARVVRSQNAGLVMKGEGALLDAFRAGIVSDLVAQRRAAPRIVGSSKFSEMSFAVLGARVEQTQ
jgi:glycosyltransferase involved in cell wall biosynthesis